MQGIAIIGIIIVIIIGLGAAFYFTSNHQSGAASTATTLQTTTPTTVPSSYAGQTTTIAPATGQIGQFTKVHVGQSAAIGQYNIALVGIDPSHATAILNVTSPSYSGKNLLLGQNQYLGMGSGAGAPYILVSQINLSSSNDGAQNWVMLEISNSNAGFSASSNGNTQQNTTSTPHGNYTNSSQQGSYITELRDQQLSACGTNTEFFGTMPLSEANFTSFGPLGWVSPGGHVFPENHGGFYLRTTAPSMPANVPVVAPGNVTVFEIIGQTYLNSNNPPDYAIYFAPCGNVTFYFGHVQALSSKLASAYAPPFVSCQNSTADNAQVRTCQKMMNVSFVAGERIGNIGGHQSGNNAVQALDLGVYDYTLSPAGFANQSRYDSQQLHAACPLNYFASSIQNYIYTIIGIHGLARTEQPLCGLFMQDVPGAAQGGWFQKGTPSPYINEGVLISLIHNDFYSGSELFSIGLQANVSGLAGVTYYFKPTSSGHVNRDFGNVTADGTVYCYDSFTNSYESSAASAPGMILLQLVNASTLRIEYQGAGSCGSGPWSFTSNHADFYR
ncbi:MAG: hypothetical protein ACREBF_03450 [Candidatus Micrarchaeales archaeon]